MTFGRTHVRRQVAATPAKITEHAAGVRRIDPAREEPPRLHHLVARVVNGRCRVIATAYDRELVASRACWGRISLTARKRTMPWEICLNGPRISAGASGFMSKRIELARRTEVEDHDHGAFVGVFRDGADRL